MHLELGVDESTHEKVDENLFNGLKDTCFVTKYPFPTILYKVPLNFCQNRTQSRDRGLPRAGLKAQLSVSDRRDFVTIACDTNLLL